MGGADFAHTISGGSCLRFCDIVLSLSIEYAVVKVPDAANLSVIRCLLWVRSCGLDNDRPFEVN